MITYDQYRNFPRNTGIPEHELRRKFFLLREDHLTSGKQSNPCLGYPLFPNLVEVNYGANSDDQSIYEGTSLEITNAAPPVPLGIAQNGGLSHINNDVFPVAVDPQVIAVAAVQMSPCPNSNIWVSIIQRSVKYRIF